MKNVVLYHRADFDGIFCREIAHKFLPEAELIGWDYGDPIPELPSPGADPFTLYMLDISIDPLMIFPGLIWIDHHKSAIEKYKGTIAGYRIDGVAACRLAWQWFTRAEQSWKAGDGANPPNPDKGFYTLPEKDEFINRTVDEPPSVRLAGEYDIWDKRNPDAELFQHGLRSEVLDWELLLSDAGQLAGERYVQKLLDQGRVIQFAREKENASIIKEIGFTFRWEGLTWLACNHARYNSLLFTAGITRETDALFGFKWTGKTWSVSLYHAPGREQHDLSKIAVKYGGGGHRGACGFQTDKLPFQ